MAIRMVSLGGTDFVYGEKPLKSDDLNDTFDELQRIAENTSTGHNHDGSNSSVVMYPDMFIDSLNECPSNGVFSLVFSDVDWLQTETGLTSRANIRWGTTAGSVELVTYSVRTGYTCSRGFYSPDMVVMLIYGTSQDFNDASDWTKTTVGTVTYTTTKISPQGNGDSGKCLSDDLASYSRIAFLTYCDNSASSGSGGNKGGAYVKLTDGSNTLTIYNIDNDVGSSSDFVEVLNSDGGYVVYQNGVYVTRLEGWSALKVECYSRRATVDYAVSSSEANCYFVGISGATSTAVTHSLSADGGSNYETVSLGNVKRFSNTGNNLKGKSSCTLASGEVIFFKYNIKIGGFE